MEGSEEEEEYEYEYPSDEEEDQDVDENDETAVEIENSFYEADGAQERGGAVAARGFQRDIAQTASGTSPSAPWSSWSTWWSWRRSSTSKTRLPSSSGTLRGHRRRCGLHCVHYTLWRGKTLGGRTNNAAPLDAVTRRSFKALQLVVVLLIRLGKTDTVIKRYERLLELIGTVTRNEAADAINSCVPSTHGRRTRERAARPHCSPPCSVLDTVSQAAATVDATILSRVRLRSAILRRRCRLPPRLPSLTPVVPCHQMYEITLGSLKAQGNERQWFSTSVKLAKVYMSLQDGPRFSALLQELLQSCRSENGEDDPSKATSLMELYALELQVRSLRSSALPGTPASR